MLVSVFTEAFQIYVEKDSLYAKSISFSNILVNLEAYKTGA